MAEGEAMQSQIQFLLSDFNTRLRDAEERNQLVRERILLLGKNLIESEQEIENLNTILTVRSLNPDIEIISLVNSFPSLKKFQLAGVSKTLYPHYIFSKMVTMYIQSPKIFQVVKKVMFGNSDIFIDEVLVKKNKFLLSKKISEIDFKKFKILIFGVVKSNGKFIFKPSKDFQFEIDDKIIIFGNIISLSFFSK